MWQCLLYVGLLYSQFQELYRIRICAVWLLIPGLLFPKLPALLFSFGVSPFFIKYFSVELGYFREDREGFCGSPPKFSIVFSIEAPAPVKGLSVSGNFVGEIFPVSTHGTFTHQGFTDNQCRTFFFSALAACNALMISSALFLLIVITFQPQA